ncbi:MAG: hypothetical protein GC159_08600 [Phycisphaera sp.]|nr:hypothetical protein [Phycisphaera sp.]
MMPTYRTSCAAVLAFLAGVCLGSLPQTASAGYPEPEIVTTAWELDFSFQKPDIIAVRMPGEDRTQLFWYMVYTVSNKTGEDQMFIPNIWMLTDGGDLMQANQNVPPVVFREIKAETKNVLLESPAKVVGRLLQGPDNARDSVAIWPVPDHDVNFANVFIGGLSGETHEIKDAQGKDHLMKKTLMIDYQLPGDQVHIRNKKFLNRGSRWIVR